MDGMKSFGWYLTLVQFIIYTFYAYLSRQLNNHSHRVYHFCVFVFEFECLDTRMFASMLAVPVKLT